MEQQELLAVIEACKAGDRQAQEKLVAEAQKRVYFHCRKMLKNEDDALDATQDILIAMLTGLDKLREPAAFWGWLNGITANRCKHLLTQGTKEWQMPEDEEGNSLLDDVEDLDEQVVPDKALDNQETSRLVMEIISALPDEQKMCVLFYYYDEMTTREIAEAIGVPEGTVKSRLNHARKSIKDGVEKLAKKGTKLYGISPLPFLAYFLRQAMAAESLSPAAAAALIQGTVVSAASVGSATAGAAGAGTVAATGTGTAGGAAATGAATTAAAGTGSTAAGATATGLVGSKIALGLAGLVVVGTVAGGVALTSQPEPTPEPTLTPTQVMEVVVPTPEPTLIPTPEPTPTPVLSSETQRLKYYREDYGNGAFTEIEVLSDGRIGTLSLLYDDTGDVFIKIWTGDEVYGSWHGVSGKAGAVQVSVTESTDLTIKYYSTQEESRAGSGSSERSPLKAKIRIIVDGDDRWLEVTPYVQPDSEQTEDLPAEEFVIENGVLTHYNGAGGNVTIPEGVTVLDYGVFSGCEDLVTVKIPDSVTEIKDGAFSYCNKLKEIVIPDSVTKMGNGVFTNCYRLTCATLSQNLLMIKQSAFSGCSGLTSIVIPERVTVIEQSAFYGCNDLVTVSLPKGLTKIDSHTFGHCRSLTNIVIPIGIDEIGWSAFYNCTSLTYITIPDGTTTIEGRAFQKCAGLTGITIPASVTTIEDEAFDGCPNVTIHAPAGSAAETYAKENNIPFEAI